MYELGMIIWNHNMVNKANLYIYKDIANDVEKRFYISNYEAERILPIDKNKRVIALMVWLMTKISEIEMKIYNHDHGRYITAQEINKLTSETFAVRLAQVNLTTKADIDYFVGMADFDDKLKNSNKKLLQIKQNTYGLKKN